MSGPVPSFPDFTDGYNFSMCATFV
jgi:hypothetical protein